ncbi:MAG: hypothetical protein SGJ00_07595 [bacterium]|nr:hypothetical protein [bacterium]
MKKFFDQVRQIGLKIRIQLSSNSSTIIHQFKAEFNICIDGTPNIFYWVVENAYKVEIYPQIGDVTFKKGRTQFFVSKNILKYTIRAYGKNCINTKTISLRIVDVILQAQSIPKVRSFELNTIAPVFEIKNVENFTQLNLEEKTQVKKLENNLQNKSNTNDLQNKIFNLLGNAELEIDKLKEGSSILGN